MSTMTRPGPAGEADGQKFYDLAEVVAYRKASGVTQTELATRLRMSQEYVSMIENADRKQSRAIQAVTVEEMLEAIDAIAARREKLVAEGLAALAAVHASRQTQKAGR
jgi:transcriptional regulator with XRE-family HTH domain